MNKILTVSLAIAFASTNFITPLCAQNSDGRFIRTATTSVFETDFTKAAENTVNEVVCIKSYTARQQRQANTYDPFADFFGELWGFGQRQQEQRQPERHQKHSEPVQSGLGSGVIISEDGYIVTNNHVIDGADRLEVLLNDNSSYDAKVIGTDEATDLALLKINAKNLQFIKFGDSDALKVGEWVLAVGNPFGFNSTVTAGIVSAKARSLGQNGQRKKMSIDSYIQTDAALNPGNSGGALVNLKGELIGINSAIYSNTGSYAGFSFAIPTSIVKKVMTDLKQYGTVQRGVLGCTVRELDASYASEHEITATKTGLVVNDVNDHSTAKEIGLQADDIITAIDGKAVDNFAQLAEQLSRLRPGDQIKVTFVRNNKTITKSGTLRNAQGSTSISQRTDFTALGCAFMKLTKEQCEELEISSGVKIIDLKKGPVADSGAKEGFVITDINGQRVASSDDVESIFNNIMKVDDADRVMLIKGIYPTSGKRMAYAVNLFDIN